MGASVPLQPKPHADITRVSLPRWGRVGVRDHPGVHQEAATDDMAGMSRSRLNSNMWGFWSSPGNPGHAHSSGSHQTKAEEYQRNIRNTFPAHLS